MAPSERDARPSIHILKERVPSLRFLDKKLLSRGLIQTLFYKRNTKSAARASCSRTPVLSDVVAECVPCSLLLSAGISREIDNTGIARHVDSTVATVKGSSR